MSVERDSTTRRKLRTFGFEWPGPDAPTCDNVAVGRTTGRSYGCLLARGHFDLECHWQKLRGDELDALTWIATGKVTYVGTH